MNSPQKPKVTVKPTFTNEFGLTLDIYIHELPGTPKNASPILTLLVNDEEVERREVGLDEQLTLIQAEVKTADDYELRINDQAVHQGVC